MVGKYIWSNKILNVKKYRDKIGKCFQCECNLVYCFFFIMCFFRIVLVCYDYYEMD